MLQDGGGAWVPQRDPRAETLAALITEHHRDLLRTAYAVTASRRIAADATEATWRRAAARLGDLRSQTTTRRLLLGTLLDEARRRARPGPMARLRMRLGSSAASPLETPPGGFDEPLAGVLAGLGDEDRLMLALRYGAARTSEEIAAQLEISGAGVRAHLLELRERILAELAGADPYQPELQLGEAELDRRFASRLVRHWDAGAEPGDPRALAEQVLAAAPRRHMPRLRRGARIAIGAVAVVGVLVAAVLVAPSGSANRGSPTPAPGTLVKAAGWEERVVATLADAPTIVGWDPAGAYLAVARFASGEIDIYDARGELLRTVTGTVGAWTSNGQLLTLQSELNGWTNATSVLARAASSSDDRLLNIDSAIALRAAGGAVAVSLNRQDDYGSPQPPSFVIVRNGTISAEIRGEPVAWSGDGRLLAYVDTQTVGFSGKLRVLDASSMRPVDVGDHLATTSAAAFDPGGRTLAACIVGANGASGCTVGLIDLETGTVQDSGFRGTRATLAFAPDGTLVLWVDGVLHRWRLGDAPVAFRWQPESQVQSLATVANGIVITMTLPPRDASLVSGESPGILVAPGRGVASALASTRDGRQIAYARRSGNRFELVLASVPAAAGSPAPTPTPAPSTAPLVGVPVIANPAGTVTARIGEAGWSGGWGASIYTTSTVGATNVVGVMDLTDPTLRPIDLGIQRGEEIGWIGTDGTWFGVLLARPIGEPGEGTEQCPGEARQARSWRLVVAHVGPNLIPDGPARVMASGINSRVTSQEFGYCAATTQPQPRLANGMLAYNLEAPAPGHPWAERIIVRDLANGNVVREIRTESPAGLLTVNKAGVAWTEVPDVTQAGLRWGVYASTSATPARHAVATDPGHDQHYPAPIALLGEEIIFSRDSADGRTSSVWRMPIEGGPPTRIGPADLSCNMASTEGDAVLLICRTGNAASFGAIWTTDGRFRILEQTSFWADLGGGWVHLYTADNLGQKVVAFRLDELAP